MAKLIEAGAAECDFAPFSLDDVKAAAAVCGVPGLMACETCGLVKLDPAISVALSGWPFDPRCLQAGPGGKLLCYGCIDDAEWDAYREAERAAADSKMIRCECGLIGGETCSADPFPVEDAESVEFIPIQHVGTARAARSVRGLTAIARCSPGCAESIDRACTEPDDTIYGVIIGRG